MNDYSEESFHAKRDKFVDFIFSQMTELKTTYTLDVAKRCIYKTCIEKLQSKLVSDTAYIAGAIKHVHEKVQIITARCLTPSRRSFP